MSQANMYGDDCQSATNYPIVRLHDPATGAVWRARTYQFSTMAVATGSALQSCRFTPIDAPYGSYDLYVIANGISSHPIPFAYIRPGSKPFSDNDAIKSDDRVVDPAEIALMRQRISELEYTVSRLNAAVVGESPHIREQLAPGTRQEKEKTRS